MCTVYKLEKMAAFNKYLFSEKEKRHCSEKYFINIQFISISKTAVE